MSVFETLSVINVNDKKSKKNNVKNINKSRIRIDFCNIIRYTEYR